MVQGAFSFARLDPLWIHCSWDVPDSVPAPWSGSGLIELEAGEPERLAFILNRVSRRPLVLDQLREICEWIEASQPTP